MRYLLCLGIRFYKICISPLMPKACRFYPSCSGYAEEAIEAHGAVKGIVLSTLRIAKCHPFGSSGFDPVPKTQSK